MAPPKEREVERLSQVALTASQTEARRALRRLGFKEPQTALQGLDRLAGEPPLPLPVRVLVDIAGSGLPDQALQRLERFIDSSGNRLSLFARFVDDPALAQNLVRVIGFSHFLTDLLVRNPEYLYWLFEETPYLREALDKNDLRKILEQDISGRHHSQSRLEALRVVHRREWLRIGVAEVLGLKPVAQIGRELSDLADVVLEVVLDEAWGELTARFGRPRDERGKAARFCIVCLGKHGGQELNYSSDVDLLFAYDEEGRTRPRRKNEAIENSEFFQRLGERLIQILTEITPQGFFYRVDMRLRPEGGIGALVRSLRSYWIYYETQGELWERQMLIKARRAAGSQVLWKRLHDLFISFSYGGHFATRPQEEIGHIKERIEAEILTRPNRDNNIKLQAGGIRDVEFVVQCLQLLNGRINPQARSHHTLGAIEQLLAAGVLSRKEARELRQGYEFLRRLENLLQIEGGRSVYAVPEDAQRQKVIAVLMGQRNGGAWRRQFHKHLRRVRAIFDRLFYQEAPETDELKRILELAAGTAEAAEILQRYGFVDGAVAHRNLEQLAAMGRGTGRENFEALLPELIVSLASAPDPDQGLLQFVQVVSAYGAASTFYHLLHAHAGFRKLLISLCGSSRFLAELIQRDPTLLDGLVTPDADGGAVAQMAWKGDIRAIERLRQQELLRLGCDDLLGLTTAEETFLRLTELAEEVLQMVFSLAWRNVVRRRGKPRTRQGGEARFACFAGGKFGGREMDFGSDLDLFFVYEGEGQSGRTGTDNSVFFIEVVQELIALLQGHGLFEVDARLRPEGRSAPMAIALPGYRRYLQKRAATWERLALSRARLVAGDAELGRRVMRSIHGFVFRSPVDAALVQEVGDMRRRMEPAAERRRSRQVDIKRGAGGMVDVEFIAQVMVLKWGKDKISLRLTSTRQVLEEMMKMQLLAEPQGRFLLETYDLYRRVEKGLRLASEQAPNTLPEGRELVRLARSLGIQEAGALAAEIEQRMQETRCLFESLLSHLAK